MEGTMRRTLLATAVLAAFTVAAQAQAPAPSAPAEPERTLRPVVVTPTPGVAQDAFDTPASVDVVDRATLRNAQLQVNLSESLARVPGVVALNRQNYAQDLQISIRGFGARSTFGVRGLRLFADGIPATAPDGQGQVSHFDLSSADRVEVLRGPFSSLYGNSSGGVISLFTADGGPGQAVDFSVGFGSDGVRRQNLRLSGEEGPWNWNLSATNFETDGYREHSAAQRKGFNGKVRYTASKDTRVTFVLNSVDMPDVQDPLGLTRAELEANPRQASPAALTFNTRKSVDQLQGGMVLEHRLDAAQSLKLTTWRGQRGTEQFQAIPNAPPQTTSARHPGGVIALDRDYQGVDGQWILRSRLAGGPLTLTAGLMADELTEHRQGFQNFAGTTVGVMGALRRDENNKVSSFDQYAQAQWESERVSLTAGLRHSVIKFQSRDNYIVADNPDDSGNARFQATTPVLGAVYHVSERLNVYASAGRGFETPTFNELAYRPTGQTGLNFDLRPATSKQWEMGVKAEPAPNWRFNAALFQAQTADEISVLSNTGGRSVFQNVGSTRRRGIEAAVTGRWAEGWSTYAALTFLDATYRNSFFTCTATPCPVPDAQVAAGSRIPGIPRSSAYAEVAFRHRPRGLETALEFRYIGRIAVDDRNTDSAPPAALFNLRASLAQNVGRWTLRQFLRVDNVADRKYVGSVIVNEGNRRYFEPAPGRTWLLGLDASYKF
jgi:iron complex outermembrane receptor protein